MKALHAIKMGGRRYEAGDTLPAGIDAETLAALIRDGAVEAGDERAEAIARAIAAMLESDPERADRDLWTEDGRAHLRELNRRCGFPVKAADRDAVDAPPARDE